MPRPVFPPTPSSSTDILAKDGLHQASSLHLPFELPPPAIYDASSHAASADASSSSPTYPAVRPPFPMPSPASARPTQVAEPLKARRRPPAVAEPREAAFTLPPPPTRSRKIIQIIPRQQADAQDGSSARNPASKSGGRVVLAVGKAADDAADGDRGSKRQASAASAAGRKIARKTAHSLIERRRRCKMNEEFAVLKNMIPACSGEMHKLAILQASIDYIRYLEDCVVKLKAQHDADQGREDASHNPLPPIRDFHPTLYEDPALVEAEMTDSDTASPVLVGVFDSRQQRQPSVSPALRADDADLRRDSHPLMATDRVRYGYSNSAGPSPALGCRLARYGGSDSALTSPALNPHGDLDHEATAALLMLNRDRRDADARGRCLSVRDLLST
ncbi:hypothetical protein CDD83_9297 [Cordyceps sp. RAO-2017]|nr:hypothetical protein CDD83_9297 [Cordyceps sp. RAO-2017]